MTATRSSTAKVTLPTDDQILITREFDAPRRLVYQAWTTPDLVKRWWSGQRGQVTIAEIDLRVGGAWRYVMTANAGFEVGFHGAYREIVPEERIVYTEVFRHRRVAVCNRRREPLRRADGTRWEQTTLGAERTTETSVRGSLPPGVLGAAVCS